jgi:hypothetical protein
MSADRVLRPALRSQGADCRDDTGEYDRNQGQIDHHGECGVTSIVSRQGHLVLS